MNDFKLEVIAFNLDCCSRIEEAGAHRIELCSNPAEGGTTPSYGFINAARNNISLELFPIIRPRGGDFIYNDGEFGIMKDDIAFCRHIGCDGVVTGLLNPDGTVDKKRGRELVAMAYPMSVTFHRAFDRTSDPYRAMEDIIDIGCHRILTSGLMPSAMSGLPMITSLIEKADNRIIIMPGSGIRSDNIERVAKATGATEFHTSARRASPSKMDYINTEMDEVLKITDVDDGEVKAIIRVLSAGQQIFNPKRFNE